VKGQSRDCGEEEILTMNIKTYSLNLWSGVDAQQITEMDHGFG